MYLLCVIITGPFGLPASFLRSYGIGGAFKFVSIPLCSPQQFIMTTALGTKLRSMQKSFSCSVVLIKLSQEGTKWSLLPRNVSFKTPRTLGASSEDRIISQVIPVHVLQTIHWRSQPVTEPPPLWCANTEVVIANCDP